jgi:hypothetical protein
LIFLHVELPPAPHSLEGGNIGHFHLGKKIKRVKRKRENCKKVGKAQDREELKIKR